MNSHYLKLCGQLKLDSCWSCDTKPSIQEWVTKAWGSFSPREREVEEVQVVYQDLSLEGQGYSLVEDSMPVGS